MDVATHLSAFSAAPHTRTGVASPPCNPIVVANIYERAWTQRAMSALLEFNCSFSQRPLTTDELRIFFATMAVFNRHTIGGIAILAGRLSDHVLPSRPVDGHRLGALVLDSAVDEYGLRESRTHVELARDFAAHVGVPAHVVGDAGNAAPAARDLGEALFGWYRLAPVPFALGVHVASELTSREEFTSWHHIFLKFKEYGFQLEHPKFEYMRVHFTHEPDHAHRSKECIERYLKIFPEAETLVLQGVFAYIEKYQAMFRDLQAIIFSKVTNT